MPQQYNDYSEFIDCEAKYRPFGPADMIFTTNETERDFQESGSFDVFGDSYFERATKASLEYSLAKSALSSLEKSEKQSCGITIREQISELEFSEFPVNWKYGIFRNVVAYIDK